MKATEQLRLANAVVLEDPFSGETEVLVATPSSKTRVSLCALLSLATERARAYTVDAEETSLDSKDEGILSLGKAASMSSTLEEPDKSLLELLSYSSNSFFSRYDRSESQTMTLRTRVKKIIVKNQQGKSYCGREVCETSSSDECAYSISDGEGPRRTTNDVAASHRKPLLSDQRPSKPIRTPSPTQRQRSKNKRADANPLNQSVESNRTRTITSQRKSKNRGSDKPQTNRMHANSNRRTIDFKKMLCNGNELALKSVHHGLYELRSDDSDESDASEDGDERIIRCQSIKADATSSSAQLSIEIHDKSFRWISSPEKARANPSTSSLQLPTRFVSPNKSSIKKSLDLDRFDKRELLLSPFSGLVGRRLEHVTQRGRPTTFGGSTIKPP